MFYATSKEFFETGIGPQPESKVQARLICLKDFVKKIILFPLALFGKLCKTFIRVISVLFCSGLLILTMGSAKKIRELFIERIVVLAKDLGDWLLLPFAFVLCTLRLALALLIHPNFYFNAL